MPFYDYECPQCGHKFTKKQSITDENFPECPKCSAPTKRVIQSTGRALALFLKAKDFMPLIIKIHRLTARVDVPIPNAVAKIN